MTFNYISKHSLLICTETVSTIRLNQISDLRMQTCCYMYSLGIQCKRQNIPDHDFYSYSVLNRSLSYICNISFLEVFDDLTNYRQNCSSSIVDGIVFASDVKRCTLSYFASVSSSETMDR
jgi:hypothetical protein